MRQIKYYLVGIFGSLLIRILFSTISIKEVPDGYSQDLERQGKHAIYAFGMHTCCYRLMFGRQGNVKVLISQHRDGEYIARVVQRLGYGVARGSTTRGGARALLKMIKKIKEESISVAITPRWPERSHICRPIRSNTIRAEDAIPCYPGNDTFGEVLGTSKLGQILYTQTFF